MTTEGQLRSGDGPWAVEPLAGAMLTERSDGRAIAWRGAFRRDGVGAARATIVDG